MRFSSLVASAALAIFIASPAHSQNLFTGDVRSACEAILCLSSGSPPSACTPPLTRYFSINFKKPSDTVKARANFLALCPAASMNAGMKSLVDAVANGAGRCDAASLNATLITYAGEGEVSVSNRMPSYCTAYTGNSYADLGRSIPRYVGTPERGGSWVEAKDYAQALSAYNARIGAQSAASQQQSNVGY